jgi:hypothetical protein
MFQKSLNINFHDNPSRGSRLLSRGRADELTNGRKEGRKDGQTDRETGRHGGIYSRFPQCFERA